MPKDRVIRRIDAEPAIAYGTVATPASSTDDPAPPAFSGILPPSGLSLSSALYHSAATPSAILSATWTPPDTYDLATYIIQWSTINDFSSDYASAPADQASASIYPVRTNTTYYVRVATVYRNVQSDWCTAASLTTVSDTTPPSAPTALDWTWAPNGDLEIRWTDPASDNLKSIEIGIWSSAAKTTFYRTLAAAPGAGRTVYTAAMNAADTASAYDPAIYIEARALSWGGVYSSAATPTTQPTKAVPAAPSGLTSTWAAEVSGAGVAGGDIVISWTAGTDAIGYRLTIDGTSRDLGYVTRYTYTLDTNIAEHSGTADPVLSLSLVALDGLRQASSAATATATNTAPATTAIAISGGFSTLGIAITASAAADFDHYTLRILLAGSPIDTITTRSETAIYAVSTAGSYTVGVKVVDVFGQSSSETISSAVVIDTLTITQLRADSIYTDSISTDFTTAPNNTILKDDATGAGVSYAASASAWRWTQIEYPLTERFRRASAKLGTGAANFYVAVSSDGSTWRWFAGGLSDGYTLTERASEAIAQSNASLLSAAVNGWVELPATIEGRYIRLYHRNTSAGYRLDEYYGYTLVVADEIKAGTITALQIASATITADRMSVTQLSAIAADMGSITAGTITGGTVQTATSGARVVLSSAASGGIIGYGSSDTYNPSTGAGTYQVLWSKADGKFYAGGGTVRLDSSGIFIAAPDSGSVTLANMVNWVDGSTKVLEVYGYKAGTSPINYFGFIYARNNAALTRGGALFLHAEGISSTDAQVNIYGASATSAGSPTQVLIGATIARANNAFIIGTNANNETTNGYLRVESRLYFGISQTARYLYDDGTYLRSSSHFVADARLYVGQTTRYFVDDGTYTRFTTGAASGTGLVGFVCDQDIFCYALYSASGGYGWMTELFNQRVKTTSDVTFNAGTFNGNALNLNGSSSPQLGINTTSGSNARSQLYFCKNGTNGWLIGTDVNGNNTNDFFMHDAANGQTRVDIGPAGNVGIQQKLYIGGIGVTPSYQIHLSTDSAGKPTGGSWANSTSDARAKTILGDYEFGLAEVRRLRLVRYEYNGRAGMPAGMRAIGFIAQEAREVIPDMVGTRMGLLDPDDTEEQEILTLSNDPAIYATMRAVQQLADLVDDLTARLAALETR